MTRLAYYDITEASAEDYDHLMATGQPRGTVRLLGVDPPLAQGHGDFADEHALEIGLQGLVES